MGFITRATKNVKGGKERHMIVNKDKINTSVKMRLGENNNENNKCQFEPCTSVKMSFDKGQIDTIKDNTKDKEKDNNGVDKTASLRSAVIINSTESQKEEPVEIEGAKAQVMTPQEATDKYGISACANRVAAGIVDCYWIGGNLVKLIRE